jgi:hypothetical protein
MVKIENNELSMIDLAKGDYISQDVIRAITGYDPRENADVYRFAMFKLKDKIYEERKFHTRCEGYAIRILTDSEDVFYQQQRRDVHKRGLHRALSRGNEIDENNLDEPTLARHRRNQLNASRELTALDTEAKRIRSEDRQRYKAPGAMPPPTLTFVSSQGEKENGTQATNSEAERIFATDPAQRTDGESAAPPRQANEEADQQAQ